MDHFHKCVQEFTTQRWVVATQYKFAGTFSLYLQCQASRGQCEESSVLHYKEKIAFEGKSSESRKLISVQQHCH